MLQTNQSVKNDVSSLRPLYCGRAGSDVMGCRQPTSGVFILYASGMGHADDVPHSDPKGTQFEVPIKGNLNIPLSTSSTTDLRTIKPEVLNLAVA